jgi:hypothetical protein
MPQIAGPRSTVKAAQALSAQFNPASAVTLPLVPLNSTVNLVIAVPRSFKPGRITQLVLSTPLPTGVSVDEIVITGNSPSYSANIKFANNTAANITPTAQIVKLIQE